MNSHHDFRNLALDRRTLLRGFGAAMALPWLDAMAPAVATRRDTPPRRVVFVFSPNGKKMDDWTPTATGRDFELPHALAPLQPLRARTTVFTGLAIDAGNAHGDGNGDHARAASSFLTGAHPRKTGGTDLHVGISIDQVIATAVGGATPFASLELGVEGGTAAGICDSGYSCAYSNNISWRTPGTPVAKETDPRVVFARLFGDPEAAADATARERLRQRRRSVLDAVRDDTKALLTRLGGSDRAKLADYLDAVHELEQRLERPAEATTAPRAPDGLLVAGDARARLDLLYDVTALALATDRTRVVTLMLGNAGSRLSYPFLGVPEEHHELSHHGRNPQKLAAIRRIDRHHSERLGRFLGQLAASPEGPADVLGHTAILFAAAIGDGDRHNHDDLPVLLCGGDAAGIRGGSHVRFDRATPMANLHLSLQRWMGAGGETFADSTGAIDLA